MAAPPTNVALRRRRRRRVPAGAPRARAGRRSDGVLGLLLGLHHNNVVQWNREDAARRDDADDRAVADAKRDIDALNAKRHELVEAIDAALAAVIEQSPSAPPTTESPGDGVRPPVGARDPHLRSPKDAASCNARRPRPLRGAPARAAASSSRSCKTALEALFDDVRTGRKRFVPYQSLKLYGSDPDRVAAR